MDPIPVIPTAFPTQLRNYFMEHYSENADEDDLTKLFKENKSVKEDFLVWAHEHESTVQHIPRLYKLLDMAKSMDTIDDEDVEWQGIAKTINQIYHFFNTKMAVNDVFSMITNPNADEKQSNLYNLCLAEPGLYVDEIFELYEAGLIDKKQQMDALVVKSPKGCFALAFRDVLKEVIFKLVSLENHELVSLLLEKNSEGDSLFECITEYSARHDPRIYLLLLKALDKDDKVTSSYKTYEAAERYFYQLLDDKTQNPKEIIDYLSMCLFEFNPNMANAAIQYMNKAVAEGQLNSEGIASFLSVINDRGTLLHMPQEFPGLAPLMKKLYDYDLTNVLSITNAKGESPLHNPETVKNSFDILENVPDESLIHLFSQQDKAGNTPLHNAEVFYNAPRPDILKPVLQIRNEAGFTPEEWHKVQVSSNWVVKDKMGIETEPLSEEDYIKKVQSLKDSIDTLWNSFSFGNQEGDILNEYLKLEIAGVNKTFTPDEIKKALDVMVDKMNKKTPWIGTPKADDKEGLHQFYSQMLNNFERVVSRVSEKDTSSEKAGVLIGIAKVELEERCAAAYQSEIEQAKMLLDSGEGVGMEAIFEKLARASLLGTVEDIVRRDYNGDSHAYSQMLYAVGMAPAADPLSMMDVMDCQQKIFAEWTKDKLLADLTSSIGRLGNEQLQEWFKSLTPENHGREFRLKQVDIERGEQAIALEARNSLTKKKLKPELTTKVLDVFQSTQGMALRIGAPQRKLVSEAVFDALNKASTLDEVAEVQTTFSKENETDRVRRFKLLDMENELKQRPVESLSDSEKLRLKSCSLERQVLQQKSIGVTAEFNALRSSAEVKIKLGELIRVENASISKAELDEIVEEKIAFDSKIRTLAERKEVDFHPSEIGLPSRGVEYQRRVDYASQFFNETDNVIKLNKRGAFGIAQGVGVLEVSG